MIVGGISGGRIGGGRIGGGRNFSGGRNGGGQHTKSEAGEAKRLRIGQRDVNKLFIYRSWRTSSEAVPV